MSTILLRPKADGNAVWGRSSGSSDRYTYVDDDPTNDATFLTNPAGSAYQSLAMSDGNDVVLASNQRVRGVTVKVRYNFTAQGYLKVSVIRYGETAATGVITKANATSTSVADADSGLLIKDGSGFEWTAANLNRMAVRLAAASSNPAGRVRVTEVYAEVDVNDQPAVTGVSVSAVDTSRPTVSYAFVDADGDTQRWRHVKVYPQSVFSLPGFSPDSSGGAVWAQEVASDVVRFDIGVDLRNGQTYRVYVRGAQDLNGQRWYSPWAFDEFTLQFDPPNNPALVRTVDNPNARVLLDLTSRINWLTLQDSSFEDTGTGNWVSATPPQASTVARTTAQSFHGVASLQVTKSGVDTGMVVYHGVYGGGNDRVRQERTYSAVVYVRAAATPRRCHLEVDFFTDVLASVGTIIGPNAWDNTSGWIPLVITGVAPAGADFWRLFVVWDGAVTSEVHYLDAGGLWPGVAQPPNRLSDNDSDLETSVGGWSNGAAVNAAAARSTAQALNGNASLSITSAAGGDMSVRHTATPANGFAVVGGDTASAWAWFRANTNGRTCNVQINWYSATSSLLSTTTGSSVTSTTTTWVRSLIDTATVPAGAARAVVILKVSGTGGASEVHYADSIFFVSGPPDYGWGPGGGGFGATDVMTTLESQDARGPNYLPANLADGGDTSLDTTGLFPRAADDLVEASARYVHRGERGFLWDPSTTTTALDVGCALDNPNLDLAPLVAPGKTMRASAYLRAPGADFDTVLTVQALDARGQPTGAPASSGLVTAISSGWQRAATGLLTIPDDAVYARLTFSNAGASITRQLAIDSMMLEVTASSAASEWEPGTGDRPAEWVVVRRGAISPATQPDQQAFVYDYEAFPGTAIRIYRAYNWQLLNGTTYIASEYAVAAAYQTPDTSDFRWWLKDLADPLNNRLVMVLRDPTQAIAEDTEEHHPLGRDGEAVVISHWIGGQSGQITIRTTGEAEWRALERLLGRTVTMLLQSPGGLHSYVRFRERSWPRKGQRGALIRDVAIPYTAVGRPPDV